MLYNISRSQQMGATKRAKVTFTCEFAMKDYLSEWADSENRTLSNLVETLIEELITQRQAQEQQTPPPATVTGEGKRKEERAKKN